MKKTIISLVVLLLFVIATCTYKKTYVIYSMQSIEIQPPTPPKKSIDKTVITSIEKNILSIEIPTQKENITPVKAVVTPKEVTIPTHKPMLKKVKKQQKEDVKAELTEETAQINDIRLAPLSKVVEERILNKKIVKEEEVVVVVAKTKESSKISTDAEVLQEIEALDSLLLALSNRNIALENREKLLLDLEKLIQEALDNRFTAIAYRSKNELNLESTQKEIFRLRDALLKKVYQEAEETAKNTYKVGE